jgi:mRNA interferase HigB
MTFMHVITRKHLNEFAEKFPDTKSALARWYANMKNGNLLKFRRASRRLPTRRILSG